MFLVSLIRDHYVIFTFISGLITVYLIALWRPTLIHKKNTPLKFSVQHSSHRGGGGENPENTLEAFKHALEKGKTDLLELDVHLTKDGQVVVLHDANLRRISGQNIAVSTMNYDELPLVHGKLPIPTLRQVFEAFPRTAINLDIKAPDVELLEKTHNLIVEFDRRELMIWGSGFTTSEFEARVWQKDPKIPRYFTFRRVAWLYLTHWFFALPFLKIHEHALEIPLLTEQLLRYPFPNASPRRLKWTVWLFRKLLLSPSLFSHLRKRGVVVILWTPNNFEEFKIAKEAGADGIMTDYPVLLRQWLDKN